MKILNIRFKNINTLAGEWEIDFEQSPLKDAELFAITGPNGSGKTTILDSISLALYGKTTRLSQPERQIISKNTADCYAAVTFSVNDTMYQSTWSATRKDNSIDTQMALFHMNKKKKVLKDQVNTVPAEIAVLTGLDFKRFSRSIMLAQGEFTAFLNALDNERAEILEKIIGPEIYGEMEKQAVSQAETETEKLKQLKEELNHLPKATSREIERLKKSIDQCQEEIDETLHLIAIYETYQENHKQKENLRYRINEMEKALSTLTTHKKDMESDILRLHNAEKVMDFTGDLNRLEAIESDINHETNNETGLKNEIVEMTALIDQLNQQKEEAKKSLNAATDQLAERKDAIDLALETQEEIATYENNLKSKTNRVTELEKSREQSVRRQGTIKKEITENQKNQKDTTAWLEKHKTDKDLGGLIRLLRNDLSVFSSLQNRKASLLLKKNTLLEDEKKIQKTVHKGEKHIKKTEGQLSSIKQKRTRIVTKIASLLDNTTADAVLDTYQKDRNKLNAYYQMIKINETYEKEFKNKRKSLEQSLTDLRTSTQSVLEDYKQENHMVEILEHIVHLEPSGKISEPKSGCPICGSDHPPITYENKPFKGDIKTALKEHTARVKKSAARKQAFERQMKGLFKKITQINALEISWQQLLTKTGESWEIGENRSVEQAIAHLKKSTHAEYKHIKKIKKLQKHIHILDGKLNKKGRFLDTIQSNYKKRLKDANRFQQEVKELQTEATDLEKRMTEISDRITEQLKPYDFKFSPSENADNLIRRLTDRYNAYQTYAEKNETLNRNLETLKEEEVRLPREIKIIQEELDALGKEMDVIQNLLRTLIKKKQEQYGTGDPAEEKNILEGNIRAQEKAVTQIQDQLEAHHHSLDEKQQDLKTIQEKLKQLKEEYNSLSRSLEEALRDAGFDSLQEARESVLSPEDQHNIRKNLEEVEEKIRETELRLSEMNEQLTRIVEEQGSGEEPAEPPKNAEKRLAKLKPQMEDMIQELNRIEQAATVYEEKEKAVEAQQKVCEQAQAERLFFESAGDVAVKKRIQGVMVERLITQSNRHLEALSGRYYLRKQSGEDELKIEIEDIQQEYAHRSLDTLSGGESFVVSLSMALGLADLAGPGREIQTLFIDEGFGNLDDETLYNVVATLKSLKARGKMVGIISHIKKLADEIPTQIRLERMTGSTSRMEILA